MIYEKYSIITYGFLIIGCTYNISPVINTVDLTSKDFSNSKNLKEVKACEFFWNYWSCRECTNIKAIKKIA
jgi:hypothetical protein